MLNGKQVVFLIFILTFAGVFLLLFFDNSGSVKTVRVEKRRVIKSVYASGYVETVSGVIVKSEVSGYIERIFVREGQRVRKGQVLATISNESLKKSLEEVRTRKKFLQERLDENSSYLRALRKDVEIRKLNSEYLRDVFNRRRLLLEKGLISRELYEEAQRSYEIAQNEYEKALDFYRDSLESLKTEFQALQAREEGLLRELEKYSIRSPVDGEILRKFVEEGDYVNTVSQNNQLFSVGNSKNLETVLLVDEEYVPLIEEGFEVLVATDAFPNRVFEGRITLIEKEADRRTRTVKVKADVRYPENIPVGVTVEANIILSDREGLFISKEAYRDGYVEVVKDGKLVKTPVRVGMEKDNYIEVIEGLKENQEVIVR
ncbi:Cobalt-zinc-cadmium resistance protein CzcB [bacterium HR37]|nr:Cobalt-zinc-cadmium resistance protein CzcB [bacterium HR37]